MTTHMIPPAFSKVRQMHLQCVLKELKAHTEDGEQEPVSDDESLYNRQNAQQRVRRAEEAVDNDLCTCSEIIPFKWHH